MSDDPILFAGTNIMQYDKNAYIRLEYWKTIQRGKFITPKYHQLCFC